jgi:glycosyltransferase involved in cell wall biosynthesis
MRVGQSFARAVARDLSERYSSFENHVFFGYNTASLETLDRLDATACTTIVDQIDPGRVEKEIVIREAERWPDWVESVPTIHEGFEHRLRAEWETADWVVVNSAWSKEALVEQCVDPEKIQVVPLAYEPPSEVGAVGSPSLPLRVLWLGTVNLRKGIPYLVQAARALEDAPIQFQIVGPIEITEKAITRAPSNVEFVGRIPRGEIGAWYKNADVFVLPTLSDGFAITQLEAMAHGLPVIATPRCGSVVTDGQDGMLVPPRDETALTKAFTRLIEEPGRLAPMSRRALETAKTFTLDRIAEQLMGLASEET